MSAGEQEGRGSGWLWRAQNRLSRANRCSVGLDYIGGISGAQIGVQRIEGVA